MVSSKGSAPIDASSGDGKGAEEKWVMDEGQTLLMRMSMSCEGEAAECIAASDL